LQCPVRGPFRILFGIGFQFLSHYSIDLFIEMELLDNQALDLPEDRDLVLFEGSDTLFL